MTQNTTGTIIKGGSLVFDIGAHRGESINKFQKMYGAGLVVSVEPHWENYLVLLKNIVEKHYHAVALHAAAWSGPDIVSVHLASNQTGLTTLRPEKWGKFYPDAGFEPAFDVPTVTIDMLKEHYGLPQYVKIDVEGCESDVLRGMTFKSEYLSFEFHGFFADDAMECFKMAMRLGYTKASWVEADVDLVNEPSIPIELAAEQFAKAPPEWGNVTLT